MAGILKRIVKWTVVGVGTLVLAVAILLAVAWAHSERALQRSYAVADPPLPIPSDPARIDHGGHLFATRGCAECHGAQGEGRMLFDAGPIIRLVPPNITPAALAGRYDDVGLAAAIRHGVRPDGTPLVFMPSQDFAELGDDDTAALIAYLRALPPSDNDPGRTELRIGARVLYLLGDFPLTPAEHIDHAPRARVIPAVAATATYGAYVARTCTSCHRADYTGGIALGPGAPPSANLTPRPEGLGGWTEADFVRALREGVRPDGRKLDPLMPVAMTAAMTDTELAALWAYFSSLPPRPTPR